MKHYQSVRSQQSALLDPGIFNRDDFHHCAGFFDACTRAGRPVPCRACACGRDRTVHRPTLRWQLRGRQHRGPISRLRMTTSLRIGARLRHGAGQADRGSAEPAEHLPFDWRSISSRATRCSISRSTTTTLADCICCRITTMFAPSCRARSGSRAWPRNAQTSPRKIAGQSRSATGAKIFFNKNLGLRFDLRGIYTALNSDTAVFCSGGCSIKVVSSGFVQTEISAALMMRF